MDSEEAREIAHHAALGKPETDEGPYYHESWWEAYKGTVKGLLGGLIIGAGVGLAAGGVALGLLAAFTTMHLAAVPVLLGFAAVGAVLGGHEFSQVGNVTGAVSAAHEKAEERIKEFENSRFAELKREIRGLKAAMMGQDPAAAEAACEPDVPSCAEVDAKHSEYRTQHCDTEHCVQNKPIFWKIAAIGGVVGTAAGALLGASGFMPELLHPLGHIAQAEAPIAGSIVGGTLGASFGINRDIFRRVFDKTDRLFKGIVTSNEGAAACEPGRECATPQVLMEQAPANNRSKTYFRDKIGAEQARRALLAMDHTNSIRN